MSRIEFFVDTRPIAKQSFRMGKRGGYLDAGPFSS